jgi:bifunctional DNA-binding transcriptional regulator/antitoxin component of YhaV-PrlF toxin-antitoxin module
MEMAKDNPGKKPDFYGSVTMGERGQVSIPAEARREMKITDGTKLLVFSGPHKKALLLVKIESVTEFISSLTELLAGFEDIIRSAENEDVSARKERKH